MRISPETNAHSLECLRRASDHLKEAIALLLCSNADVEPIVHVLRPVVKELEAKGKP